MPIKRHISKKLLCGLSQAIWQQIIAAVLRRERIQLSKACYDVYEGTRNDA